MLLRTLFLKQCFIIWRFGYRRFYRLFIGIIEYAVGVMEYSFFYDKEEAENI
jgi:hypothetical protein